MLQNSFVHLAGVGPVREKKLWAKGIRHWADLRQHLQEHLEQPAPAPDRKKRSPLPAVLLDQASEHLDRLHRAEQAYRDKDLAYFYRFMPRDQLWRMVPEFFDDIAYLDIETTGSGLPPLSYSTTICFYFRGQVYQEHEPAKKQALIRRIYSECKILVTFFGEVFDVPFLTAEYGIPLEKAHLDLCFWLKRNGFKGGLKKIQKLFSDIPSRNSMDLDGFDAVRLWRLHQKGVPGALETLMTYNAEDTVVLEPLLLKAYELETRKYPEFALPRLAERAWPKLGTQVSPEVYQLLRSEPAQFFPRPAF